MENEIKAQRFTFSVTIEQDSPEEGRNFGSKEQWAETIKRVLNEKFHTANVLEVVPIRTNYKATE